MYSESENQYSDRPPVTAYLKAQQSRISEIFLYSELFVRRT